MEVQYVCRMGCMDVCCCCCKNNTSFPHRERNIKDSWAKMNRHENSKFASVFSIPSSHWFWSLREQDLPFHYLHDFQLIAPIIRDILFAKDSNSLRKLLHFSSEPLMQANIHVDCLCPSVQGCIWTITWKDKSANGYLTWRTLVTSLVLLLSMWEVDSTLDL